jgi:hypothetical protein
MAFEEKQHVCAHVPGGEAQVAINQENQKLRATLARTLTLSFLYQPMRSAMSLRAIGDAWACNQNADGESY